MSENVAPAVREMTPHDPGGAWTSTKTLQQKIYNKFSCESEKQALNPKDKNSRAESYQLSTNRSIRLYFIPLWTCIMTSNMYTYRKILKKSYVDQKENSI